MAIPSKPLLTTSAVATDTILPSVPVPPKDAPAPAPAPAPITPAGVTIRIFSADSLREQPWLPELVALINASFRPAPGTMRVRDEVAVRLKSIDQLPDEIGSAGFTAVAFAEATCAALTDDSSIPPILPGKGNDFSKPKRLEIIGTASVKAWTVQGSYKPAGTYHKPATAYNLAEVENMAVADAVCDGDYEIAVVALKPGARYRKRGIAEKLVRTCEEEILRRRSSLKTQDGIRLQGGPPLSRPVVRTIVRVVKVLNEVYWMRRGFVTIGEQWCPSGTWDILDPFVLVVMARDVLI